MTYFKTVATPPGEPAVHVEFTPEEAAVYDQAALARQTAQAAIDIQTQNQVIKDQLAAIDARSIRALRTNDVTRLAALEAEAVLLRSQIK
jgi:hypothetical protein